MSDLAATNCGCGEERSGCGCGNCGCNNGCGCDNGCGLSFGNGSCGCNILWIIILLCACGATVLAATTAVATEMVTAAGSLSSFCFSAVDGGMAAAADLSFPHMKKGCLLSPFQKNRDSGNFPLSPFSGIF